MEDKIEVGEYVRINKSSRFLGIGRVIKIAGNTIYLKMYIDLPIPFSEEGIKECRHSKNIIDLIEVGDYVNGDKVYKITGELIYLRGKSPCHKCICDIKSIVTKEQFKQVQYEVRD